MLFTYYDLRAPPTIEVSSPLSGPCGVGGAHVPSSYPGDEGQIEVTPSGELMISLHGTNYAPTPMLTCVYRYYEEQLLDDFGYHSANDEHQEYWVQAVFENAGYVRCPVPTRHFADPGADVRLSSTMPLSATNDGMIYHYSNHSYEQLGCEPIPEDHMFEALIALLALGVGCCAGGAYKFAKRSKDHSLLKRQKQIDLLRKMAGHLYATDAEYDEAFDAYLAMIGARKSSRDDHHVDFLEHALDVEREYREIGSPKRKSQGGTSPATKGGYTQLTDEHEPAMPHGYTKPNSATIRQMRDPERDNVYGGLDVVGTLELHIVSGTNLLSADSNGLSDPFVKVRLLAAAPSRGGPLAAAPHRAWPLASAPSRGRPLETAPHRGRPAARPGRQGPPPHCPPPPLCILPPGAAARPGRQGPAPCGDGDHQEDPQPAVGHALLTPTPAPNPNPNPNPYPDPSPKTVTPNP